MKKAFTLVELLIVIAILGILIVGILIALDPVEQTRRASDTTVLTSAGDVKNAVDRYYASKLYFPWCDSTSPAGGCSLISGCAPDSAYLLNSGCGATVATELVNTGELKSNLPSTLTSIIYLALGPGATTFNVSFNPASKAYDTNKGTKYINSTCATLDPGTTCTTAPNACYLCL